MHRPTRVDLQDEVLATEPHPDVNYDKYSIDAGQHYVFDENDSTKQTGYRNYTAFVKLLESKRGGIKELLHATKAQIAGAQSGTHATGGLFGEDGDHPIHVASYVKRSTYASRWKKFIQFPALLETLQAWGDHDDSQEWVLLRVGEGHSYQDIAMALGVTSASLIEWMVNHTDTARLKAAWTTRTETMLEQADQLFQSAAGETFDTECSQNRAESQARVLSSMSSHLKLQAVARHPDYQPKKNEVTVTPGSISISFAAPE